MGKGGHAQGDDPASVPGAEIVVDDLPVGVSPLADPVVVNAGRRKLSAKASGYTPAQRVVDVAATSSRRRRWRSTFPKIDAERAPGQEPPPPKGGPSLVAWVTLSVTGAGVVAAVVTGAIAVSAHSTQEHDLGTFPGNAQSIADAQSRTRTLAVTTDVLIGITAAAAVTGTAALFFRGGAAVDGEGGGGGVAGRRGGARRRSEVRGGSRWSPPNPRAQDPLVAQAPVSSPVARARIRLHSSAIAHSNCPRLTRRRAPGRL